MSSISLGFKKFIHGLMFNLSKIAFVPESWVVFCATNPITLEQANNLLWRLGYSPTQGLWCKSNRELQRRGQSCHSPLELPSWRSVHLVFSDMNKRIIRGRSELGALHIK